MNDMTLRINGAAPTVGYYSTQERRTKAALEARRTHFVLGKHGLQRNFQGLAGPVKVQTPVALAVQGKSVGKENNSAASNILLA